MRQSIGEVTVWLKDFREVGKLATLSTWRLLAHLRAVGQFAYSYLRFWVDSVKTIGEFRIFFVEAVLRHFICRLKKNLRSLNCRYTLAKALAACSERSKEKYTRHPKLMKA